MVLHGNLHFCANIVVSNDRLCPERSIFLYPERYNSILMNRIYCLFVGSLISLLGHAQVPDSIYSPSVKSPQLYMAGNQVGYPILQLNSADQLELHFDDLDADVKNYYYTIQ